MKLFGKRYLGLSGTRLNIAIGIIAGIDFLYVCSCSPSLRGTDTYKTIWL
jgi:hypothetical protein